MSFSELNTLENPVIHMLNKLGYDYVNGYDENIHNSCFGRDSIKDVLLFSRLNVAVHKLNPQYSPDTIMEAMGQLMEIGLNKTTAQANKDAYHLMKDGAKVTITNETGDQETVTVRFFDFDAPENNEFLVVNQLTIQ